MFFKVAVDASQKLHNNMFASILRAHIGFFDTNPVGKLGKYGQLLVSQTLISQSSLLYQTICLDTCPILLTSLYKYTGRAIAVSSVLVLAVLVASRALAKC